MQTSVKFHYVHVINCLPLADAGGSRRMYESIESISVTAKCPKPIYNKVESASELLSVFADIEKSISIDNAPLIHIDAHADKFKGLEFLLNGATPIYLNWDLITKALGQINEKISNRLFVVFCACSAFNINGELHPKSVAPFSVCVSPFSAVTLAEIETKIPIFYQALLMHHDIVGAAEAVVNTFFLVSSEHFLKDVLVKMTRTTIGKNGRERREHILTGIISQSKAPVDFRNARKSIKESLELTDMNIQEFSSSYLCGREFPFTAEQIKNEARQFSSSSSDD